MNSLSNWENTFMRIAKKNKGHFCVPILLWNEFYFFKQANHVYLLLCMLKNNASCHCCFFYRKWRTTFSPCSRKVLALSVLIATRIRTGRYLPGWATVPSLSLCLFRNLIRRVLCHLWSLMESYLDGSLFSLRLLYTKSILCDRDRSRDITIHAAVFIVFGFERRFFRT